MELTIETLMSEGLDLIRKWRRDFRHMTPVEIEETGNAMAEVIERQRLRLLQLNGVYIPDQAGAVLAKHRKDGGE